MNHPYLNLFVFIKFCS